MCQHVPWCRCSWTTQVNFLNKGNPLPSLSGILPWSRVRRQLDAECAALLAEYAYGRQFTILHRGGYEEGPHGTQIGERHILPVLGQRGEDAYHPGVALQQHLLNACREGKVALEGEGAIGEGGLSAACLVAIGMEGVGQAEALREGAQRIRSAVAIEGACLQVAEPGVGVAAPPGGSDAVEPRDGGTDDALGLLALAHVDESQRVDGLLITRHKYPKNFLYCHCYFE